MKEYKQRVNKIIAILDSIDDYFVDENGFADAMLYRVEDIVKQIIQDINEQTPSVEKNK